MMEVGPSKMDEFLIFTATAIWTRSQMHCGGISNQARIPETSPQLIFLHTGTPPDNVTVSRGCELIICFHASALESTQIHHCMQCIELVHSYHSSYTLQRIVLT